MERGTNYRCGSRGTYVCLAANNSDKEKVAHPNRDFLANPSLLALTSFLETLTIFLL